MIVYELYNQEDGRLIGFSTKKKLIDEALEMTYDADDVRVEIHRMNQFEMFDYNHQYDDYRLLSFTYLSLPGMDKVILTKREHRELKNWVDAVNKILQITQIAQ